MKVKCIALDMDRTTLDVNGSLPQENRRAIEAAIAKGIHVIIASGRAFSTLPVPVMQIPGIEYAITSNGAAVYHISTRECLKQFTLNSKSVHAVIEATQEEPIAYEAFIGGNVHTDKRFTDYPQRYGLNRSDVDYFGDLRRIEDKMPAFLRTHSDTITSLNIYVRNQEIKRRIWNKVAAAADNVYITTSFAQVVEVSDERAGKDAGLKFMLDYLGLTREETAAFGDGDNDIEMLNYAGCGIAMENATEKCKKAADIITLHHNENGVAHGFRKILGLL